MAARASQMLREDVVNGELVVPPGYYFAMGDNRDNSLDSRYWGFVPDSLVLGSPMIVYFSYAPDSTETLDWLTHVRWSRLGGRVR
jgi:signal peptidase I